MGQNVELSKLEQFVEKLLSRTNLLRDQKAKLEAQLIERDRMIKELQNSLAAQDSERSTVNQRLSKIVEHIEEWEQSLDEEVVSAASPALPKETNEEDVEDTEHDVTPAKGQHNLFSVAGGKS